MSMPEIWRTVARYIVILWIYVLVAAASFSGLFAKYAFFDFAPRESVVSMLDGTAERPYVYRQLLPTIANAAEQVIPHDVRSRLADRLRRDAGLHKTFALAVDADNPAYTLRYHIVYMLAFTMLLGAMLMMRMLCIELIHNEIAATLAPLAFALVVPASKFYDFPELFFMTLAVWVAVRGKIIWLLPITLIATYNKESFFFFVIALYPFATMRLSRSRAIVWLAASLAVAVAVNLLVKNHFASNGGGIIELHLGENLRFLLHPYISHVLTEVTYGIPFPKRLNFINLFIAFVIVRYGWRSLPRPARQHAILACAINVPLFLLFGYGDEIRALSMVSVSAVLLVCASLSWYLAGEYKPAPEAAPAGNAVRANSYSVS